MEEWKMFANFVREGLWVESSSDEKIVWFGVEGWNFYYRISGLKTIQWHVMLYNPSRDLLYYRDEAFNKFFTAVTLRIRFRVSSNVLEITVSKKDGTENDELPEKNTATIPEYYAYFLEPPVVKIILNRYPVERIYRSPKSFVFAISGTKELVTDISYGAHKCAHGTAATKFYLNCVKIHSHQERFSFTVAKHRPKKCSICYRLSDLDADFKGYRVRFDRKETEFLFNY